MDLALSADQLATSELASRLFGREVTPALIRSCEQPGHSPALWSTLVESGIPGMGVAPDLGGGGADLSILAIVAEEAGRTIAPVPLVEHLVATRLLARTQPGHPRLAELVAGEAIATLAVQPARQGVARLVPAGAVAHLVVALDGDDLVAVDAPPAGIAPDNHASAPVADRPLDVGDRLVLARGPAALEANAWAIDEWRVLTAAALTGLARAALDLAVDYVKQRHQFGVPIGSFQAVQHGLADLPGEVVGSHLLVQEAAWALDSGLAAPTGASGPELASMAFLFAGELARDATARCVQYHGGYGVAEEYDAQLLYRRARGWPLLLGDPAYELQHLGELLVDDGREA